jgi:hypothetical protein
MTSNPPPTAAFMTAAALALKILSARLLAFLALGMTFGLFCYALAAATWISYISAGSFAILVYLPALWSAHRGSTS